MSRWFRHYAGMMRDDKLVRVAVACQQPVERVLWVWGAILESAAEINDSGRFDLDPGEVAYFLRCDNADICSIINGLENCERIAEGVVVRWSDRQFDSDTSRERQRRYRQRKACDAVHARDGDVDTRKSDVTVTSQPVTVTLQETDTDTEDTSSLRSEVSAERRWTRARLDALSESVIAAGSINDLQPTWIDMSPIVGLIDAGYDLDIDVIPKIREVTARLGKPAGHVRYFVEAIRDAGGKRASLAAQGRQHGPPARADPYAGRVDMDDFRRWADEVDGREAGKATA